MDNIAHEYLNKLRIISKISTGQRLDTTDGLSIYNDTYFSWILRKWYHDSKDEGVRVLKELFSNINQYVEQLSNEIENSTSKSSKIRCIIIAKSLARNIRAAIVGLENLAKTYDTYPKTSSTIEGIVYDFAIIIYTQLLELIPVDMYSKELYLDVKFLGDVIYKGIGESPTHIVGCIAEDRGNNTKHEDRSNTKHEDRGNTKHEDRGNTKHEDRGNNSKHKKRNT